MITLELKLEKQDTFHKIKYLTPASEKDRVLFKHLYPNINDYTISHYFDEDSLSKLKLLCEAHNWVLDINARKKK